MIRNENQNEFYVIVVKRGNEEKYIAKRHYSIKNHMNCTVKPNEAMRFKTIKYASEFWDRWKDLDKEITFVGVKKIVIAYLVEGGIYDTNTLA